MKIVFMGTPEFAVPSLDILVKNGYDIVGVVTATDKLGGRGGKQLLQSAVKQYAVAHNLPVLQPEKLKNPEFIEQLRGLGADLYIVVAFRMLPEIVWNMPPLGTMNLHGSLLPKYRGAAPINWAVINGNKETGVTTFFLKHEIDTGDVLFTEKIPIGEDETAGDLHDKMMDIGAKTVLKSVKTIEKGGYVLQPQADVEASHAPKIFNETCHINFNELTEGVHNFVRGLSPYPTAWTTLDDLKLKVFKTEKEELNEYQEIQIEEIKFETDQKTYLKVVTKNGYIHLLDVQLEGRKRMLITEFLNGYKIKSMNKEDIIIATKIINQKEENITISDLESWLRNPDSNKNKISSLLYWRLYGRYIRPLKYNRIKNGFLIMASNCLFVESFVSFISEDLIDTKGKSEKAFKYFFSKFDSFMLFTSNYKQNDNSDISHDFYENVRCKILHNGETGNGWKIKREGVLFNHLTKIINANLFQKELEKVLTKYCDELNRIDSTDDKWKTLIKRFKKIIETT